MIFVAAARTKLWRQVSNCFELRHPRLKRKVLTIFIFTASTTESDRMRAAPQKLHPDPSGSENQRMEPVDEGGDGDEDEDEVDLR